MTWYRSLYWRIAVGFIACLALLLVVQGMLFVWMMSQAGSTIPNQPPERFAQTVAIDVAQALERDGHWTSSAMSARNTPRTRSRSSSSSLTDRVIEIGARFPEPLKAEARARLETLRTMDPARVARGGAFGRGGPFRSASEAAHRTGAGRGRSDAISRRPATHCRPSRTLPRFDGSAPFGRSKRPACR